MPTDVIPETLRTLWQRGVALDLKIAKTPDDRTREKLKLLNRRINVWEKIKSRLE